MEDDKRSIVTHTKMEEGFDEDYKYNNTKIGETESGALYFSAQDGSQRFIYLYADQVEELKKFLLNISVCDVCEEEKECIEFKGEGYKAWVCKECLEEKGSEKDVANNITCPECKSENCFVWEVDSGVAIECKDCGMKDFQPNEKDME